MTWVSRDKCQPGLTRSRPVIRLGVCNTRSSRKMFSRFIRHDHAYVTSLRGRLAKIASDFLRTFRWISGAIRYVGPLWTRHGKPALSPYLSFRDDLALTDGALGGRAGWRLCKPERPLISRALRALFHAAEMTPGFCFFIRLASGPFQSRSPHDMLCFELLGSPLIGLFSSNLFRPFQRGACRIQGLS
jgi:hypothetical protein